MTNDGTYWVWHWICSKCMRDYIKLRDLKVLLLPMVREACPFLMKKGNTEDLKSVR